ncbi:MAG UNVERIFIED_CONTAM: hypothetical protein LVT10_23200 [Anaerolineae bacterium]
MCDESPLSWQRGGGDLGVGETVGKGKITTPRRIVFAPIRAPLPPVARRTRWLVRL